MLEGLTKEELIELIKTEFAGVTRGCGVSWSEALVAGYYFMPEERVAARLKDTEKNWLDLVDDGNWDPSESCYAWTNLDSTSLPYYFAAAMLRCVVRDSKALTPDDLLPEYKFFDLSEDFDSLEVKEDKPRLIFKLSAWIRQARLSLRLLKGSGFPTMEELTGNKQIVSADQIVSMKLGSTDLSSEIDFTKYFRANLTPGQFRSVAEFIRYNAELPTREALQAVLGEADMTWEDYENEGGGWTPDPIWSEWSRPLRYWVHHLPNGQTLAT